MADNKSRSKNFSVSIRGDVYVLSWSVSRKHPSKGWRYETHHARDTDYAGAVRFCNKHGIQMPVKAA